MIVHLVTDRRRLAPGGAFAVQRRCLLRQAEAAVAAGIDHIQLREPDLDARDAVALVRDLVAVANGSATRILVNDRVDVALAGGAHGVHLPARGLTPEKARRLAPAQFVVGVSVHDATELARAAGADYLVAGTVWPSLSKPEGHRTVGLDGFRALAAASPVAVLAIGGVTVDRAHAVAEAGGGGVAAIGLFAAATPGADDDCRAMPLEQVVRDLRHSFDTARSRS